MHRTNSNNVTSLTTDDWKVLGKAKQKLCKIKTERLFQTNKYNTLNSSWTPLKDQNANKTMFDDRVDLVCNWFEMWSDKQRKWFLLSILGRCRPPQLFYVNNILEKNNVFEAKDFTQILPKYVSLYIFSFLSSRDLSRCAQVNSHWKYLSEQDELWIPKCVRYGWFLPYRPRDGENGAWKFYYILCILALTDLPLTKEDTDYFKKLLFIRDMTEKEKEDEIYRAKKRERDLNANYNKSVLRQTRQGWLPSSFKPKDMEKAFEILVSNKANYHDEVKKNKIDLIYRNRYDSFDSIIVESNNKLLRSSLNEEIFNELSQTVPLQLLTMREAYTQMQTCEPDLRKVNFETTRNLHAYLNFKRAQRFILWRFHPRQNLTCYLRPIHILLISSKVACCNLLLQCVKFGVLAIPYDYESASLHSLFANIDHIVENNIAETIGFFVHSETSERLELVQGVSVSKNNVENDEIRGFFKALIVKTNSRISKLDFFVPLAASDDGLEITRKIHEITGITVRAPVGYSKGYKFIKGRWLNFMDKQTHPINVFFDEQKLNVWLTSCEILKEAHNRLSSLILSNYVETVDRFTINQIVGAIIQDSLSEIEILYDEKIRENFISLVIKASKTKNEKGFLKILHDELAAHLQNSEKSANEETAVKNKDNEKKWQSHKNTTISIFTPTQDAKKDRMSYLENSFTDKRTLLNDMHVKEDLMGAEHAIKSFLKYKPNVLSNEIGMRSEIILDFVKAEINYMYHLEIIQNFYYFPFKTCKNSDQIIINDALIDVIFNDVYIFYGISRDIVKALLLRLKNWNSESCVVDVLKILCNNSNAFINYANNYDTIVRTIDKLVIDNPRFRAFLLHIDQTICTNMLTLYELLNIPWTRINDYIYLLNALRTRTSNEHPEQLHIDNVLPQIQEIELYTKNLKDRVEKAYRIFQVQRNIINCPNIIRNGRYLLLEQNAILLSNLSYNYVKDIKCFIFNDSIIIAYRFMRHFAFVNYCDENLVFHGLIDDLSMAELTNVTDNMFITNILLLKVLDKEYYISFDSHEQKQNFNEVFEKAKEVSI